MLRTFLLLTVLLLPSLAHADSPPLIGEEEAPAEEVRAPAPPEDPAWRDPLIADMTHHLGAWGVSTIGFGLLETGFMISSAWQPPGWFQGATVNLTFVGVGLAGFMVNGVVLAALKRVENRRAFAHHTRRAAIGSLIIATGLLHAMVWPILPALSWEGWSPEGFGLLAFPFGAVASALVLGYWATRAEKPRRPGAPVVMASPTGIAIRF